MFVEWRNEVSVDEKKFMIEYIEGLEEQIARMKKELNNTIKLKITYGDSNYEIDTQIEKEFKEGEICYLANDNDSPSKVEIMGYKIDRTIGDSDWILYLNVLDLETREFEFYKPNSLFKKKKDAIEAYYNYKYGQLYKDSPEYNKNNK